MITFVNTKYRESACNKLFITKRACDLLYKEKIVKESISNIKTTMRLIGDEQPS